MLSPFPFALVSFHSLIFSLLCSLDSLSSLERDSNLVFQESSYSIIKLKPRKKAKTKPSSLVSFLHLLELSQCIKLYVCSYKNNSIMSESQTLNMANLQQNNKNLIQQTQFREHSIKDESIANFDMKHSPQELKEIALNFISTYNKIDDTFPINTLKESAALRMKQYKESTHYGEFHNGKKQGFGIMVYKNMRIYEGEWANDQKKGFGAEKFPNQCSYKGEYLNGKPHGVGCYTWPNGQYYDGEWSNGFKHGSGMWRGQKGDAYKGQWKFGKPEGYGVHTWVNGDTYQGQFKECLKHGEGIERFSNGDMYKGSYINGKPSGYGEYYWLNGSYFKGNFINGLRDGKGTWKKGVGNSDRYDGNYRNDKKWGYGVFTWASGNVYKGNYEADLRSGFGEMYWVDGSYYKGQWSLGIQNGEGEIYIPTEGFKRGLFENNKIVEVWEERLINKAKTLKSQVKHRRMTEQQEGSHKKGRKGIENRQSTHKSHKSDSKSYLIKEKYRIRERPEIPERIKSGDGKQGRRHLNEKRSINLSKDERQSYFNHNQNKITPQRQKVSIGSNMNPIKFKMGMLNTMKSSSSRDRLLHSSFYLYKLNLRHNAETHKNLKRDHDNTTGSKPVMLFRGKLLPSDF